MKIQLDTKAKTIKLEDNIKLSALVKTLEELLPKGLWKEFTLETNTIINQWSKPIIYKEIIRETHPYPWYPQPWLTYKTTNNKTTRCLSDGYYGIYNIEA